jgi:hypothetical protein
VTLQIFIVDGDYGIVELRVPLWLSSGTVRVASLSASTNRASGAVHIRYDLPGLHDDRAEEPWDESQAYDRHRASMALAKTLAADTIAEWFSNTLSDPELPCEVHDHTERASA